MSSAKGKQVYGIQVKMLDVHRQYKYNQEYMLWTIWYLKSATKEQGYRLKNCEEVIYAIQHTKR